MPANLRTGGVARDTLFLAAAGVSPALSASVIATLLDNVGP